MSKLTMKAANVGRVGSAPQRFDAPHSSSASAAVAGAKRKRYIPTAKPVTASKKFAEDSQDESEGDDEEEEGDSDEEHEPDTDEEIGNATKVGKSKKTAKRKRRAVSPTAFGQTLQGLLGVPTEGDDAAATKAAAAAAAAAPAGKPAPGGPILALAPHLRKAAQSNKLSAKAARLVTEARLAREERARVKDVIAGWRPPGMPPGAQGDEQWETGGGSAGHERRLRKVAQRGVVKLFNAIRAAQNTSEADLEDEGPRSGLVQKSSEKGRNELGGKGKAVAELSKSNFLDLLRAGRSTAAAVPE